MQFQKLLCLTLSFALVVPDVGQAFQRPAADAPARVLGISTVYQGQALNMHLTFFRPMRWKVLAASIFLLSASAIFPADKPPFSPTQWLIQLIREPISKWIIAGALFAMVVVRIWREFRSSPGITISGVPELENYDAQTKGLTPVTVRVPSAEEGWQPGVLRGEKQIQIWIKGDVTPRKIIRKLKADKKIPPDVAFWIVVEYPNNYIQWPLRSVLPPDKTYYLQPGIGGASGLPESSWHWLKRIVRYRVWVLTLGGLAVSSLFGSLTAFSLPTHSAWSVVDQILKTEEVMWIPVSAVIALMTAVIGYVVGLWRPIPSGLVLMGTLGPVTSAEVVLGRLVYALRNQLSIDWFQELTMSAIGLMGGMIMAVALTLVNSIEEWQEKDRSVTSYAITGGLFAGSMLGDRWIGAGVALSFVGLALMLYGLWRWFFSSPENPAKLADPEIYEWYRHDVVPRLPSRKVQLPTDEIVRLIEKRHRLVTTDGTNFFVVFAKELGDLLPDWSVKDTAQLETMFDLLEFLDIDEAFYEYIILKIRHREYASHQFTQLLPTSDQGTIAVYMRLKDSTRPTSLYKDRVHTWLMGPLITLIMNTVLSSEPFHSQESETPSPAAIALRASA